MKLFIDDLRNAPDASWTVVRTVDEAFAMLNAFLEDITDIGFDHDLADHHVPERTGYTVACYLEKLIFEDGREFTGTCTIQSSNPAGRLKIQQVIDKIKNS